jgi:hypothetical protein
MESTLDPATMQRRLDRLRSICCQDNLRPSPEEEEKFWWFWSVYTTASNKNKRDLVDWIGITKFISWQKLFDRMCQVAIKRTVIVKQVLSSTPGPSWTEIPMEIKKTQ